MPALLHKRCLIVGGTSGIGLATARRFVQEGARVVVAGLAPGPTEDVRADWLAQGMVGIVPCDVTQGEQVASLFQSACAQLNGLDVLCHAAGGSGRRAGDGPLHECTEAGWQWTMEKNLTSVYLTNQQAVRHFLAEKQAGVILNVASVLAWSPAPDFFDTAAYTAAKGGIVSLSRLAAARYAPQRIRVNVLAPGLIDTPMAARAVEDPAIRDYLLSKQPLGPGPGLPDDCASAAVFLCSDEARILTGCVLPVDGGWCVREG